MNTKKYFVTAILLSTVLLAFAASLWQTKRIANETIRTFLTGPSGKFGPVITTVLSSAKTNGDTDILDIVDLETGRALLQPPLKTFDARAEAILDWIRTNRLDISCFVWSEGAACVTYNMAIEAAASNCWEATTEQELLNNPALAVGRHHPRRLLVLGNDRPNTYVFRTGEGTLGVLRIVGLSPDGQGVNIRYKLINPPFENSLASVTETRAKRDF